MPEACHPGETPRPQNCRWQSYRYWASYLVLWVGQPRGSIL